MTPENLATSGIAIAATALLLTLAACDARADGFTSQMLAEHAVDRPNGIWQRVVTASDGSLSSHSVFEPCACPNPRGGLIPSDPVPEPTPEAPTPVPLPGGLVLLSGAIAGFAFIRRKRNA